LNPKDKTYGCPPEFGRWYHRNYKERGQPDASKEEAEEAYQEWKARGKPGPDKKGKNKDKDKKEEPNNNESSMCIVDFWVTNAPKIVGGAIVVGGAVMIIGDIILGGPTGEGIIPGTILINRGAAAFK
jgi:hypothetical protein